MEYPFSDKFEASDPSLKSPGLPAERTGTLNVSSEVSQERLVDDFAQATQDLLMKASSTDRASAARKLAKFGRSSAVPYLIAALSDNSQEVRLAAAESLGQLGDSETMGHLRDLLTRQSHSEMEERIVSTAIHSIATREGELPTTAPGETNLNNEPETFVQPTVATNAEANGRLRRSSEPEVYTCTLVEPLLTAEIQSVSQEAPEPIDRMDEAQARLAALEQLRLEAETTVCERAEREIRLQAEIKALRETGAAQLKRIEEAEAEARRLAEEQTRLQSSTEARRKADAEDRQRAATETLQQVEDEARLRAENQEQMLEHLETIRAKSEAAAQRRTEKERLLNSQLLAFSEAAAEQLKRIEKAETNITEAAEALQQAEEKARQTAEQVAIRLAEIEKRRQVAAEQQAQADEEARALAEKEEQRLAELEGIHARADAEAKKRAETENQLNNDIEALRKAEAIQRKRIEEVQAEVQRLSEEATRLIRIADQEEKRLADLKSLRSQPETMSQPGRDKERPTAEIQQTAEVGVSQAGSDKRTGLVTSGTENLPTDLQSVLPTSDTESLVEHSDQSNATSGGEAELVSSESVASSVDVFEPSTLQNSSEQSGKPANSILSQESIKAPTEQSPIATSLAECFRTGNPVDRANALQELAQLDQNSVFTLITSLFDNSSEAVRNAAARALYDLSSDRAETFTRALQEASPERRLQIIRALDSSGLAEAAIDNLTGESREKTQDAFSLLYLMSQAGEIQTLLEAVEKHPNSPVRLSVIKLLSFSNRPDIIPALRRLAVRGALPIEVRSALMALIYEMSSVARERSLSAA